MKDTAYAYCVARIRANEKKLLDKSFINKLIESESYDSAVNLLKGAGWIEAGVSVKDYIRLQNEKLWTMISESVPDKDVTESLCVLNDYFNIKCAVKCALTGEDAEKYFIKPTTLDFEEIKKFLAEKNFTAFKNSDIGECLKEAYDVALKTESGQNAEVIIDSATLKALKLYSKKYKNSVFSEVCDFTIDSVNIKTAYRCLRAGKNIDFVRASISAGSFIDHTKLISCISEGEESLTAYLMKSRYAKGVAFYNESPVLFEKWCDETVVSIVSRAKFTAFGFDPVCAYYYARLNEIKNIRIILTSKQSGVAVDEIKERVRASYV